MRACAAVLCEEAELVLFRLVLGDAVCPGAGRLTKVLGGVVCLRLVREEVAGGRDDAANHESELFSLVSAGG